MDWIPSYNHDLSHNSRCHPHRTQREGCPMELGSDSYKAVEWNLFWPMAVHVRTCAFPFSFDKMTLNPSGLWSNITSLETSWFSLLVLVRVSAGSRYPFKLGNFRRAREGLFTKVWVGYIGDTRERIRAWGGKGTVWSQGPSDSSYIYEGQPQNNNSDLYSPYTVTPIGNKPGKQIANLTLLFTFPLPT